MKGKILIIQMKYADLHILVFIIIGICYYRSLL